MVVRLIEDRAKLQGEDKILKLFLRVAVNESIPDGSVLSGIER